MNIIYRHMNKSPHLPTGSSGRCGDKSERRIWLAALAVRLLVFGLIIWSLGGNGLISLGDSSQYLRLAKGLLDTGTLSDPGFPGLIEGTRPPGYPLYLAAFLYFGVPLWVASLIQIMAASFIPIFVMKIGVLLGFERKLVAIAGWFTTLEPLEVLYSVTLLSDAFGALFFIAGAYFLVRFWRTRAWKNLILASLILGAMNYVRPIALFLYILIPALILAAGFILERWRWKEHLKAAVVFAAVFYLVLTPWLARNYYDFNHWGFLSANSRHLYDYSAVAVRAAAEGTTYEEMRQKMRREISRATSGNSLIRKF
ncbi:MAG: glycosyltransferase family 39 protein [Candidatus Sungbacteria bacterium]|nr:glycosyltransferase family 39 protein [Candidatus Sungbacteria bacterium]